MQTDFENILCYENDSIATAMEIIGRGMKKTAFVLAPDTDIIVGTVTDGDIRRGLLKGISLSDEIKLCMNTDFIYINKNEQHMKTMKVDAGVAIVPVVSKDMKLIGYEEKVQNSYIPIASPQLSGNEFKYLVDAFLSTWISSSGEYINKFEKEFSQYCGTQYGVATSNGTTALHLALVALEVGPGDEVIVPDITFAATINAVLYTGATPVIVDIEEDSWCISPIEIEKAITTKTKAIIPVHIYGQPCDMGKIMEIAKRHNLYVVEDCAEAHGAEYAGQKVGSIGHIGCFSFFGNKVITTGEGGMCLTNDQELEKKMRLYKDHGMSKTRKYYHEVIGYNYRMTNLQAAIGVAQLERIDEIHNWRQKLENYYYDKLSLLDDVVLQKRDLAQRKKIVWLVSILVDENKKEKIAEGLKNLGVDVRYFFVPLSEMEIYKQYTFSNDVSKKVSRCGINLPTTFDISLEIVDKIVNVIKKLSN